MFRSARTKIAKALGPHRPIQSDQERARQSSFPFLSGDTFRSMAGEVWDKEGVFRTRSFGQGIFFVDSRTSIQPGWVDEFRSYIAKLPDIGGTTLIIHNDDHVPDQNELEIIATRVSRVFCVNIPDGIDGVTPIPLGLENVWYNKSGRLRYYLDRPVREIDGDDHDRLVLSSFSIGTNPHKREPVARLMESSRHGHQGMVWKSGEFREVIARSLFVISPPGNGADAHRTWESIYLGAVPVVERTSLAASLVGNLPILAVDRYEDFLDLTDDELIATYQLLRQRPVERAYAPYWVHQIMEVASGVAPK